VNSHGDTTFVTTKLEARCDLDVVAIGASASGVVAIHAASRT